MVNVMFECYNLVNFPCNSRDIWILHNSSLVCHMIVKLKAYIRFILMEVI